jgi:hypothetical protein
MERDAGKLVCVWCLVAVTFAAGVAGAGGAPVVVVVDASRSLTKAELSAELGSLNAVIGALPAETPVGVLVFNDSTRWLVPPGALPRQAADALRNVVPAGRRSVLLDSLVVAGRELSSGGVIVVATDGRDEGSVTTVSDVSGLLNGRHVAVITLGVGRRLDERALRRLALLTGGEYLGHGSRVPRSGLATAIERIRRSVESVRTASAQGVSAPSAPLAPPVTSARTGSEKSAPAMTIAEPAVVENSSSNVLPYALAAAAIACVFGGFVVWRMRRPSNLRLCEDCGRELAAWETYCSHCRFQHLQLDKAEEAVPTAPPVLAIEDEEAKLGELFDRSAFEKAPSNLQLDKTFSLQERSVLVVRQARRPARSFAVDPALIVTVGRDASVNTVAVEDQTISAQHFKIVPHNGEHFILDLGSTNGTQVNGQRVRVHRLRSGDIISTGEVEFELRTQYVRPS